MVNFETKIPTETKNMKIRSLHHLFYTFYLKNLTKFFFQEFPSRW